MILKYSLVILVFCLVGCNPKRDTSDIPLNEIDIDEILWIDPSSKTGIFRVDFISAGTDEEEAPPLGTVSGSANLSGRDSIRIVSGENIQAIRKFNSSLYGANLTLGESDTVSVQFTRSGSVQNTLDISLNTNFSPQVEVDHTTLTLDNNAFVAALQFGVANSYDLPDGAYVGLSQKALTCEGNGEVSELARHGKDDPFHAPRLLARISLETLSDNPMQQSISAISLAKTYLGSLRAGNSNSCSFEIRAIISFAPSEFEIPFTFDDLVYIENNGVPPTQRLQLILQSSPIVVRVERSAVLE